MTDDASNGSVAHTSQPQWAGWRRRCFIGVVLAVELAFVAALLACLISLWRALDFS